MPFPLHVPRVNNNDDVVKITDLSVKEGDFVRRGQIVGSVETDKAVVDVEAESEGHVLKVIVRKGDTSPVGSVFLWLGAGADEPIPETPAPMAATAATVAVAGQPTAKARALLKELGVSAADIPCAGDRLTVADIENWLAEPGRGVSSRSRAPAPETEEIPDVDGEYEELSPEAHGMMMTVQWHRDRAAPAYLEIEYDTGPWQEHASRFAKRHKLMLPPLMPLMALRLVEIAKATPRLNAAIVDGRCYRYRPVNLGFTVQVGEALYLTVVRDAQDMDARRFLDAMGDVQRRAMAHKLRASELAGATIAYSSMARWNVSRHIPILPPRTGLIVAHAAPRDSARAVLGVTYDHRLLSGFDVVRALERLAQPPEADL